MRTAILITGLYIGDCVKTKPTMMNDNVSYFYIGLFIIFFIMDVLELVQGVK